MENETLNETQVLTEEEAAKILRCSKRTLYRMRTSGTGPKFMRMGDSGTIRYTRLWIDEYLESSAVIPVEKTIREIQSMRGRGEGCLYRRDKSPFWWMKYSLRGKQFYESTRVRVLNGKDEERSKRDAEKVLWKRLQEVGADVNGGGR